MDVPTVTCDVCGRQKGPTNNWFKCITPKDRQPSEDGIAFGLSCAEIDHDDGLLIEDICGRECAHKRLSRWMESVSITASHGAESESK
jgi:hypothetical protein